MIRIFVNQVDFNGVKVSGKEKVADMEFVGLDSLVKLPETVDYDLTATQVNGGVLVSGRLEMDLECQCARCLKKYEYNVKCEEVCHFYETGANSEIDLTPELREDILITFPQNFICSSDCKGLCPVCGENKNVKSCRCGDFKEENSCWNELDKLALSSKKKVKKKK
ncbi:MAG TPA: hypothetical protein DET40_25360 [Lentisphaeria bacterium]|nr:MAG: hypothetical protein A2X45_18605 [Lentisphaerae bacterium GWF2_50_93]HCE46890.1 hypothetical protein [Lentisphaeria bacterium]